jgi:hypothetical protein
VRLGATLAHLSQAPPIAVAQWAKRLVGAGFESLWIPQVIGRGFLVPDVFVTLAVAATATEGVEVGTAIVQVPLHHPADLAHRILSLVSVWRSPDSRRQPWVDRSRLRHLRRAIVCFIQLSGRDDLGPTGELLQRYAEAGFDDAVVLIEPGGPDPEQVRALLP